MTYKNKEARADYLRKWREKNRERLQIYNKDWRKKNLDYKARAKASRTRNRIKVLAQKKRYREQNREKVAEQLKRWRIANAEKIAGHRATEKRWQTDNPEQYRHRNRIKKVRRRHREVVGSHTASDIRNILKLQKNRCAICREKLGGKYHVDHILPLAKGGSNDRTNLQITCVPCNLVKGARDPIDHMQSLGRLL